VFRDDTEKVRQRATKKYEMRLKGQGSLTPHPACKVASSHYVEASNDTRSSATAKMITGPQLQAERARPIITSSRAALVQGAVAAFLTQWSVPDSDVFWGAFNKSVGLYPDSAPNSCFRIALEALSLLTLSLPQDSHKYDVHRSAMRSYGAALKSVNKTLDDPEQRINDHTFMAVIFITIFDVFEHSARDSVTID
jgi:hypothetical protein